MAASAHPQDMRSSSARSHCAVGLNCSSELADHSRLRHLPSTRQPLPTDLRPLTQPHEEHFALLFEQSVRSMALSFAAVSQQSSREQQPSVTLWMHTLPLHLSAGLGRNRVSRCDSFSVCLSRHRGALLFAHGDPPDAAILVARHHSAQRLTRRSSCCCRTLSRDSHSLVRRTTRSPVTLLHRLTNARLC